MPASNLVFELPEPDAGDLGPASWLWGTYYYIKTVLPVTSGVAVRDMQGQPLGIRLTPRSWCLAGVEGTLAYQKADGSTIVLNYAGTTGASQTSCNGFTSLSPAKVRALEKSRWKIAEGPYGDGAGSYILSPYRTLAVDKNIIPLGAAFYIPDARGVRITLPDGSFATHDGFFFAADVGGAITGRHADFFLGFSESNPFPFVTSASSGRFDVFAITSPSIVAWLVSIHQPANALSHIYLSKQPTNTKTMNAKEKEQLYTVRWYVREKWGEASAKDEVLDLLGSLLEPGFTPEDRPSVSKPGQKLLWCPFAERNFQKARTQGSYARGYPLGAIVHFTAGRRSGLPAGMEEQVNNGYLYFIIDKDGNIGQNFSLDTWGSHAGISTWPGLGDRVSNDLVGIEIQCAGKLKKVNNTYRTWFDETVPASEVRSIDAQTANQEEGHYQKYTTTQKEALIRLLTWLCQNNPEVFSYDLVLGHDEVSPGRKNDPGGSLSTTMPALRAKLKAV